MRGVQRPAVGGAALRRTARQGDRLRQLGQVEQPGAHPAQRPLRAAPAGRDHLRGGGRHPGVAQPELDDGRREAEEAGHDRTRPDRAERGGARHEVAGCRIGLQVVAEGGQLLLRLGREVDLGVDGLGGPPALPADDGVHHLTSRTAVSRRSTSSSVVEQTTPARTAPPLPSSPNAVISSTA